MNQCSAITNKSTRCKRNTDNEFCYCHRYSHGVYTPKNGWPSMSQVYKNVKTGINNIHDLKTFIKYLVQRYTVNTDFRENRMCVLIYTETLLKYRTIYFDDNEFGWQDVIKTAIEKLQEFPHLAKYCENIRRKILTEYRRPAQQRYISFYFSGFGTDIAQHIASFI